MKRAAVPSCVLLALAVPVSAQSLPFSVIADLGADGLELRYRPELAAELEGLTSASLAGVPLPGGERVTLELERVHVAATDGAIALDGRPLAGRALERGLTMWTGTIAGQPGSDVFLAFSADGSRGWMDGGSGLVHLISEGGPAARLVSDARLRTLGAQPDFACAADAIPQRAPRATTPSGQPAFSGGSPLPLLECRVAVETDTAFFGLFGDLDAAQTYLATLFGAVSARYREQVGVVITLSYLGLHEASDPWTSPDAGGSSVDMLYEFEAAWDAGAAPAEADLFHFVSGANLGGGVAYLATLCSDDYGFGVSGNVDGDTPFPISKGPLNWDFVVTAHEMGHNFGTPHTHDYCPPLDECSPYFGGCQAQQVCTDQGTIMSYCHLCPGGLDNETTFFHPVVASVMRDFAANFSCLRPFDGLFQTDLGAGLAGGQGAPHASASYVDPRGVALDVGGAPGSAPGVLVWSPTLAGMPFKGGTLVPAATLVVPFVTPPGGALGVKARVPDGVSYPDGVTTWLQFWFADAGAPQGWSASNGLQLDLILSEPLPAPAWIAHPTNGREYALSHVGSIGQAHAQALALGGDLATVDTPELNAWLVSTFAPSGLFSAFIGFHDERVEGSFAWADGSPVTYTNWGGGQPNNLDPGGQQAVELLFVPGTELGPLIDVGQWNDWTGSGWYTNRAIMERPQGP